MMTHITGGHFAFNPNFQLLQSKLWKVSLSTKNNEMEYAKAKNCHTHRDNILH